jgi:hypothetical protein
MKRITTARERFDMLSPWMITAAPPAFDKVYGDESEFLRSERPQNFPSLKPSPEEEFDELAEPPTQAPRAKNPVQLKMFPNGDFKKVKPEKEELSEGWSKEKTKTDSGKNTKVLVSPNQNQYRVDSDGNPIAVTPADELPNMMSPGTMRVPGEVEDLPDVSAKDRALPGFSNNLGRFLVPEELERSLIEKYNAADDATKEAGGQWYDTANEYIRDLAQRTGRDPGQVAAIVSAFSPQTSWDANMATANYFLMNYDPQNPNAIDDKMGGLGDNLARAKRIHAASDEDGYLAGLQNGNDAHKITNFYHNLMGSKDNVTIDSWMARALMGKGADGLADKDVQKVLNWKGGYDTMSNAVKSAAEKLGVTPRELQAIVWSQVVPTAGSYEELTPEQYAKQKKQRENYIEKAPEDAKLLPDYFHGPAWESRPEPTYPNRNLADPQKLYAAKRFWAGIQDDKYPQHWMDKAEQLARDTGGFTIHDDPNTPGDAPSSGYQVAIPGHERQDINTGQGWADYAHENQDALKGNYLGTWNDGENFWTEPSQNFGDYDDAARATVDRDQWSMWDNSAFRTNPQTGEKEFFPQADIPRHDIINQGLAGATGFTLAKNRGITYRTTALKQAKRFWEG